MQPSVNTPVAPKPTTGLPGTFVLLGKTFLVYKAKFGAIFGLALIPIIVAVLAAVFSKISFVFFVLQVLSVIVGVLFYVALIREITSTNKIAVGQAYKNAFPLFWAYIWVSILVMLVNVGSFVLLVIPGIFFVVCLMFAPIVLVTEGKRGREALVGSWRYVSGKWWKVFGRVLLAILVIGIPTGIVFSIIGTLNYTAVEVLASVLSPLFFMPLLYIFLIELLTGLKTFPVSTAPDNKKGIITGFSIWGFVVGILLVLIMVWGVLTFANRIFDVGNEFNLDEMTLPYGSEDLLPENSAAI